jgi:hypothetical protein
METVISKKKNEEEGCLMFEAVLGDEVERNDKEAVTSDTVT